MECIEYPELRQTYCYDCGACALSSVLVYYGIDLREEEIMLMAGTTEDGTDIGGICEILSHFGFDYVAGKTSIEDIKLAIEHGFPVIITIQAYKSGSKSYSECWDDGHYVVAIGYDKHRIYFEDPANFGHSFIGGLFPCKSLGLRF